MFWENYWLYLWFIRLKNSLPKDFWRQFISRVSFIVKDMNKLAFSVVLQLSNADMWAQILIYKYLPIYIRFLSCFMKLYKYKNHFNFHIDEKSYYIFSYYKTHILKTLYGTVERLMTCRFNSAFIDKHKQVRYFYNLVDTYNK